jgi:prepilin-type N-terminal cleavage/methylation domain-containing protein
MMRGFTLVELLVAMSITLLVTAAALTLAGPMYDAFQVQPETADLQQRVRVGAEALQRDLLVAGAGMYAAGAVGPLIQAIAPIMPYKAFGPLSDAPADGDFRADAISILFVAPTASQTTLSSAFPAGSLEVGIDSPAVCPAPTISEVCGFEAGDDVLVFDRDGRWDVFTIDGIDSTAARMRLSGRPADRGFPATSNVVEVRAVTYSLKDDPESGAYQLVRAEGRGPALPVVDHVVALSFQYFGDPRPPFITADEPDEAMDRRPTSYGPGPPLADGEVGTWPQGENCTFTIVDGRQVSRLGVLGGTEALVELTRAQLTDGPWCPDESARNRFDADLLRIRRVRLALGVQSAVAGLRGPAGLLFRNGGVARAGQRYVPDLTVSLDVTPRNLHVGR